KKATLSGDWTDEPWHRTRIARVYALSPYGEPLGSEPDSSWRIESQHSRFWDLKHHVRVPDVRSVNDQLEPIGTNLGLGAGANVIQAITGDINRATALGFAALSAVQVDSEVWTV
ncbi:MAG: hypothetical protein AAF236_14650, partial [Verrucomicrobiota bacterium]